MPQPFGNEDFPSTLSSMSPSIVVALLAVPVALAMVVGSILLRRALARPKVLPEEIALAAAWVFIVGSLVWLGVFLGGSSLLGFGAPWTWITAAHFAFAGFGALTITALCCRVVSERGALRTLRLLVILHPVAYLVTAAGILGFRYCDELGALGYAVIFATQFGVVVRGRPDRMARYPRFLLLVALTVPLATLIPALAWAWGHPIFDLMEMARYHGIVNAVGHVGLGLGAFAWGRPESHSVIETNTEPVH